MSLLPYVFDNYWPAPNDYFGTPFSHPRQSWMTTPERSLFRSISNLEDRLLRTAFSNLNAIERESHIGKDGFQVSLDVQHFSPNEINVKTVDNSIIIDAKHEERQDEHGYISRQFTRRYDLPRGFKTEDVVSTISSDGILTVKAPPATPALDGSNVRQVQIQEIGPARLSIKQNEDNKENGSK